jgi:Zinc finger, C2H2 type
MQSTFQVDANHSISYLGAYLALNRLANDKNLYSDNSDNNSKLTICRECTIQLENAYTFRELCRQTTEWRVASTLPVDEELALVQAKTPAPATQQQQIIANFKCPQCPKLLIKLNHAAAHKLMHKAIKLKSGAFRCSECPKEYMLLKRFNRHYRTCHLGEKISRPGRNTKRKCPECFQIYSTEYLRQHYQFVHKKNRYPCQHCMEIFKFRSDLNVHINTIHKSIKKKISGTFRCSECPKVYLNSQSFRSHFLKCHGEKSYSGNGYKCLQCPKEFDNTLLRREHIRVIHQKRVLSCDLCKKTFKHEWNFAYHKKNCQT